MTSRILHVEIQDRSLDPAQAELHVHVVLDQDAPEVEVRGRLMGPRCPYSSTVEIAYPLRPLRGQAPGATRTFQVIIPEPSLWDTESPFLYQGPVELWQDEQRCQVVPISHGLRQLTLGKRGLRLNSRPLTLHGLEVESFEESQLRPWQQRGINLLVVPVVEETAFAWGLADRFGFLVVGRCHEMADALLPLLSQLSTHASCFGWLFPGGTKAGQAIAGFRGADGRAGGSVPEGVQFLVYPDEKMTEPAQAQVPLLVTGSAPPAPAEMLLGWIEASLPD